MLRCLIFNTQFTEYNSLFPLNKTACSAAKPKMFAFNYPWCTWGFWVPDKECTLLLDSVCRGKWTEIYSVKLNKAEPTCHYQTVIDYDGQTALPRKISLPSRQHTRNRWLSYYSSDAIFTSQEKYTKCANLSTSIISKPPDRGWRGIMAYK